MLWRRGPVIVMSVLGTSFAATNLIKDTINGPRYDKDVLAERKVVIVTGANSGIGREAVFEFAKRGATVYMACRDLKECEEQRKEIVINTENRYVYCRQCDLSSFESIREFVRVFKSEQTHLHVLVNNAGVMRCPRSLTAQGIEMQLGVNHMGHFLLTNLLLDILKESAPSRVVVVSSRAHVKGKIHTDDLNLENNYDPEVAYNQSKLANVLFANELAVQLIGTGVTVNSIHPGLVSTNIVRHMYIANSIVRYLFFPFFWPFIKDALHGAQGLVYLALDPSLNGVTGKYFNEMNEAEPSEDAKNLELGKWLWATSEKWTGLKA